MIMCWKCWERWIRKCSADCLRQLLAMDVHQVIETVDELVMQGRELSQFVSRFHMVSAKSASGEEFG